MSGAGVRAVTYGPDPIVLLYRGEGYEIRVRARPELVNKIGDGFSRLVPVLLSLGMHEFQAAFANIHMQADDAPDAAPPAPPAPPAPKKSGVRRKGRART